MARVAPKPEVAGYCAAQWPDFTPPLTEMPSNAIDQLCALTRKYLTHAMEHENFLLIFLLDRDEANGGPCHCFTDADPARQPCAVKRRDLIQQHVA